MMKKIFLKSKFFFCLFFLGLIFVNCTDEELGLRADQRTGSGDGAPLSVGFTTATTFLELSTTNTSSNGRAYIWDFGVEGTDDDTSFEFAPSFTYEVDGTYTVTLTVSGDDGQEQTITQEVTVGREMIGPSASFTSEIDFLDVTFTSTSVNGASYAWDFGDGVGMSEEENPMYVYTEGGTFMVSLTVTSETDDTDTISQEIMVEAVPVPPTAGFTFEATNLDVQFMDASMTNDGTITGYLWDFGDGVGTSTDPSPTYSYTAAGTFQAVLTITFDELSGETMSTLTQSVTVLADVGATATFAAVIQNADFQSYPTAEMNNNDLVDAWTINPDDSFNDESESFFNFWRNEDLEVFVSDPMNNGGSGDTDKASSSGDDAMSAGGTSDRSIKFDSSGERAYQPFEVETDVIYNISAFLRSETTPVGDVEGTFYILSAEPADETELTSLALATIPVTSNEINAWQQISFSFQAEATFGFSQDLVDENTADILTSVDQQFVIFYFVPTNTVTSDNEVFLTDVVITTPSF